MALRRLLRQSNTPPQLPRLGRRRLHRRILWRTNRNRRTPPRKGPEMTRYQRPQDETIARQLIELGKTPDCICCIEHSEIPGVRVDISLDYNIACPVHFPTTSAVLGRKRRT